MTSLMECDGALLGSCQYLCLLLKTTDDTVNSVKEVLLCYLFTIMTGCDKCSLRYIR